MTQTPSNAALLDDALAAIREVMARMEGHAGAAFEASIASCGPDLPCDAVSLAAAPPAVTAAEATPEQAAEQLAIRRYLASASALLDASQTLIHQPTPLSPRDRAQRWMRLVEQAKTAGRTAYGAALALTDPGAAPQI